MDNSQKSAYDFEYAVVGAGPAGLAAATLLAQQGARVAVFESRPRPDNVFGSYPVVLNSRGLASLEKLGAAVMHKISSMGIDVSELHIVPNNRTVARVKTFGTGIMRDQVAQAILEAAELQRTLTFHWEHKFSGLDLATHRCTFELADGKDVSFTAGRIIAADGNRSRIRGICEEEVEGFSAAADPWGFQLRFMTSKGKPGQTAVDPAFHYVLGDKGYVCQQPDGVWSVSLRVLPETDEDFLTADEATDERVQQLREYTQKCAGFAADNLLDDDAYRQFYSCRAFDGVVVKCSTLRPLDWLCFIGDAAHAVQPATGEGINSGLEDAAVLAKAVMEHPDDPFTAYDLQHRPNAHALNVLALEAKGLVVGVTPRQNAANIMTTIGLGIGKKMRFIEGTKQDFMLGEKAKTSGIRSYAELVEMDRKQKKWLRPTATAIAALFGQKDVKPVSAKASKTVSADCSEQGSKEEQVPTADAANVAVESTEEGYKKEQVPTADAAGAQVPAVDAAVISECSDQGSKEEQAPIVDAAREEVPSVDAALVSDCTEQGSEEQQAPIGDAAREEVPTVDGAVVSDCAEQGSKEEQAPTDDAARQEVPTSDAAK